MKRALIVVAALALLAGYSGGTTVSTSDSPWRELPVPAAGARILDFVPLDEGVLALGSVPSGDGRAPAAWTSTDGSRWHTVPVQPHSGYALAAEFISAGRGDQVVALGQAFGGAHANPRMTIWAGGTDGLEEHPQIVEMFGGIHAIAVTAAASREHTNLLIGAWDGPEGRYGAAIWTSTDGATWNRRTDDPALASAPGEQTGTSDVASSTTGFVIVGSTQRDGALHPLEWTSRDGTAWQRIELPGTGATATRVGCAADNCTVFGQTIGTSPHILCWPTPDAPAVTGPGAGAVETLQVMVRDQQVLAVLKLDGTAHLVSLTTNCANWQDISLPVAASNARVSVVPSGLLLATTDKDRSRLWLHSS
ncbi:hypothetical protein AB0N05_33225 [Nocardia sp. NPDC051030]|uniref:hypothetical protein n=1 Tax=Nocardia sp. NPDC051030 TaxID=3155162 RepID=UPI00341FEFB8